MSLLEYLKSNSKNKVVINNIDTKVLNVEAKHINKISLYIKKLDICIDRVSDKI